MERDVRHYDNISRSGAKIFVGEWATQEGAPTPDLNAALADAAWLTGLERNSDLVVMSCYAPLLVNVNRGARQWATNLIGYDALSSFGSPSYYAQKMFYENRGDTVLPVRIVQQPTEPVAAPMSRGGIGVGTYRTVAEFKDLKVADGETVLYQPDFTKGTSGWRKRSGTWEVEDGAFRQTSDGENCMATAGDTAWGDYTFSVKARKISGSEGFLILFHSAGRDSYFQWNVGGWDNTRSALQHADDGPAMEFGESVPTTVESGRWYDISIAVNGHDIKCYLDGKLITQATEVTTPPDAIIATASRIDSSGQVILKVVNTTPIVQTMEIQLEGASSVSKQATGQVLTGNSRDVNTIDEPKKIYPREIEINDAGNKFMHEFEANSVTVIRLSAASQ
jgi:alpha-L-arabinofuranosidase